jgi:membrane protein YdbS with pleckstrin-like domain
MTACTRNAKRRTTAAVLILWVFTAGNAWAYLDPATGWMVIQGLIAAVAAAFVAVGTYWTRLKNWLFRGNKEADKNSGDKPVSPPQD